MEQKGVEEGKDGLGTSWLAKTMQSLNDFRRVLLATCVQRRGGVGPRAGQIRFSNRSNEQADKEGNPIHLATSKDPAYSTQEILESQGRWSSYATVEELHEFRPLRGTGKALKKRAFEAIGEFRATQSRTAVNGQDKV
jgi:hypothetical protein